MHRRWYGHAVLFSILAVGCQGANDLGERPCDGAPVRSCLCGGGTAGTQLCQGGMFGACQCAGDAVSMQLPCEVAETLEQHCWSCHGSQPQFTAPMSLVTHDDFMAPAPSDPRLSVYQAVRARLHDPLSPMPPPPNQPPAPARLEVLDRWLDQGAPPSDAAGCATTPAVANPLADDPPVPTTPDVEPSSVAGPAGAAAAEPDPIAQAADAPPPTPEGQECYELRAHDAGSDTAYTVLPNTFDAYVNFTFNAPWDTSAPIHAVSFRSLVDNPTVLHHWLLYQNPGRVPEAGVAFGNGLHGSDELVAGWAPGAPDLVLPDDVGMVLGTGFTIELHYNNPTAVAELDASGVQVCLTRALRPHEAGLHWLGTESIFTFAAGDVSGDCTPRTDMGPITILRSWPHMHLKGTHFRTVINRADGSVETLHDEPFDFNTQLAYDTPALVHPGDTLTTTCTYNSPAMYGAGTGAEMCYNFVLAYPNGALSSNGGGYFASATTTNRCLQ